MAEQWQVKRETAPGTNQFSTLYSGDERSARAYVQNNFPRPHIVLGQDEPNADVQLHGPNGERHAFHGEGAVGAGDDGWLDLNASDTPEAPLDNDDNDDDDEEVRL